MMTRSVFVIIASGLILSGRSQIVSIGDDPRYDLLPGISFSFRVCFDKTPHNAVIVRRGTRLAEIGGYALSANEDGFSFQVNIEGNPEHLEKLMLPVLTAPSTIKTNTWYALSAGWDGEKTFLVVDGKRYEQERHGPGTRMCGPFFVNASGGRVEDFSFRAPHFKECDPVTRLSPGFSVGCVVSFPRLPDAEGAILEVPYQYKLGWFARQKTDGCKNRGFSFSVYLNGRWSDPCEFEMDFETNPMEVGRRYDVTAAWDGRSSKLAIDGVVDKSALRCVGSVNAVPGALTKASPDECVVENLHFREAKETAPYICNLYTPGPIPRVGVPFVLRGTLENRGGNCLKGVEVVISTDKETSVAPARIPVESLGAYDERTISWSVHAAKEGRVEFRIDVVKDGVVLCRRVRRVVVTPAVERDYSARSFRPHISGVKTYYVDSNAGDDASDGKTEETAWKSFANLRGRTLCSGERLLLRRGSVFNDELVISVLAENDDWAEIGAYGTGARPQIRRNRHILDRCAYVCNPRCLVVRDLVFADAAVGFMCRLTDQLAGNVLFERCLAHHIEGLYRFNSHGIPEWRDIGNPHSGVSGGIMSIGQENKNVVIRDCEMYQCSAGFVLNHGNNLTVQRVYCHDAAVPNTSPHPFFAVNANSRILDSVFDASGYQASCGTMGIMISEQQGVTVRNVFFQNMPDSDSWDEGGIDFEALGENTEVDHCTFRNNAGAAIEVLSPGLSQTKNLRITGCRFFQDNRYGKLGPSEIVVMGGSANRLSDCSSGLISGNGAVLCEGVAFYTNKSVITHSDWVVTDNRIFDTPEGLSRAFAYNEPPRIRAGDEVWTTSRKTRVTATCEDDSRSELKTRVQWELLEGTGDVSFESPNSIETAVCLPDVGDYRFLVSADDGELWTSARTAVHVLPQGVTTMCAWAFARDHDLEGWTYSGLGTRYEKFESSATAANPVHDVGGDYFVVAVSNARAAQLCSPRGIGLDSGAGRPVVRVRLQNHTNARRMSILWTESASSLQDDDDCVFVDLVTLDTRDRVYEVELPTGAKVDRIRLRPEAEEAVNGTLRIDYVWLGVRK